MSRVGNPYDNAKAESFMKTLKQEEINGCNYRNLNQARSAIGVIANCPSRTGNPWMNAPSTTPYAKVAMADPSRMLGPRMFFFSVAKTV